MGPSRRIDKRFGTGRTGVSATMGDINPHSLVLDWNDPDWPTGSKMPCLATKTGGRRRNVIQPAFFARSPRACRRPAPTTSRHRPDGFIATHVGKPSWKPFVSPRPGAQAPLVHNPAPVQKCALAQNQPLVKKPLSW